MHPRALLFTPALTGLVGLSLLASACGGSPGSHVAQLGPITTTTQSSPPSTTSAQSAHENKVLAFSRCMRSHGVPNFPDPDPQGDFPPFHTSVSKQTSAAADDACKHLLSTGGSATPQQRQKKLAFGLRVARCMRSHGFPNLPDPTGLGENHLPPGIDPNSPQFQSAETACEKQAQKALGLP